MLSSMKTNKIKRVLSLIAAIAMVGSVASVFSGCQTADGLGQDVENLGENMQN